MADKSAREESRLLRWDAALRRAAAEEERVEAARQRAEAARQRAEVAHAQARKAESRADGARKRVETLRDDLDHFLESLADAVPGLEIASRGRGAAGLTGGSKRAATERERDANHREQLADEREAEADERERLADQRDAEADERERVADRREAEVLHGRMRESESASERAHDRERDHEHPREHPAPTTVSARPRPPGVADLHHRELAREGTWLRTQAAAIAESLADEAEVTAAGFEERAPREGRVSGTKIAATEREIAGILRRNAERLREPGMAHEPLEPLPRFPSAVGVEEGSARRNQAP